MGESLCVCLSEGSKRGSDRLLPNHATSYLHTCIYHPTTGTDRERTWTTTASARHARPHGRVSRHTPNGNTARRNCQMQLPDPRPRPSKLVLGTPSLVEMSVFHPANPPEPNKQHGPIPSWVLVMQISLHTQIANNKTCCQSVSFNPPSACFARLSAHPSCNLALAPSPARAQERGRTTGGAAISTWYRKHPHPHRPGSGPGPGLHVGSPGSACAHLLGSLAASPRSHAKKNPWPGAFLL